jgi:hypothetical protein
VRFTPQPHPCCPFPAPNILQCHVQRSGIAYNDAIVKSIVDHVESNSDQIRQEYLQAASCEGPDATQKEKNEAAAKILKPDYDLKEKVGEHASDALHSGQVCM